VARKLSGKGLRFCYEWPIDYDATQAAKRAGFAASGARGNGNRLLRRADVRQKINEIEQAMTPELDSRYVKTKLWQTIEACKPESNIRVNALRELAKVLHIYEDSDAVPDTINLILQRGKRIDGDHRRAGAAEAVAAAPARRKRSN